MTMPAIVRNRYHSEHKPNANKSAQKNMFNRSFANGGESLPILEIQKVLRKIGACNFKDDSFVPNQQEQIVFRKSKIAELREKYSLKRNKAVSPFDNELDQIVLDCYQYGESRGMKTVWRKYRQNCDDLSFDTMKLIRKRK